MQESKHEWEQLTKQNSQPKNLVDDPSESYIEVESKQQSENVKKPPRDRSSMQRKQS